MLSERRGRVRLQGAVPVGFEAFVGDGDETRLHVDHRAILGRVVCGGPSGIEASERAREICEIAAEVIQVCD